MNKKRKDFIFILLMIIAVVGLCFIIYSIGKPQFTGKAIEEGYYWKNLGKDGFSENSCKWETNGFQCNSENIGKVGWSDRNLDIENGYWFGNYWMSNVKCIPWDDEGYYIFDTLFPIYKYQCVPFTNTPVDDSSNTDNEELDETSNTEEELAENSNTEDTPILDNQKVKEIENNENSGEVIDSSAKTTTTNSNENSEQQSNNLDLENQEESNKKNKIYIFSEKDWHSCINAEDKIITRYKVNLWLFKTDKTKIYVDTCKEGILKDYSCDGIKPFYTEEICRNGCDEEEKECVGTNLKSNFFKNDKIAKSIMEGNIYTLKYENIYQINKGFNTQSFEYKLINAFRQLGYHSISVPIDLSKIDFLNKTDNLLDKPTLLLIDSLLSKREKLDKQLAESYPPFNKFISSPLNEPSKEHLAALYAGFFGAMPENIIEPTWTIDEFRDSLIIGLGGNLGGMMDPNEERILNLDEKVEIMNNKGDFLFCSDAYYKTFKYCNCTSSCQFIPQGLIWPFYDFDYMYMVAHEYGHGIGKTSITLNGITDRADTLFGKISFDMSKKTPPLNLRSETLLRGNNDEFVGSYSKTQNGEDWAESFATYVLMGNIFRERAKSNIYLQQKYDFIKENIFNGKEFDTGSIISLNKWELKHKKGEIPYVARSYQLEDSSWVWDYEYKQK